MKTLAIWRESPFSLRLALVLVVIYGVLHALGARDAVSVLSGTPVPSMPLELAAPVGMLYVLAYFGAILAAPILALSSAIAAVATWALARVAARRRAEYDPS